MALLLRTINDGLDADYVYPLPDKDDGKAIAQLIQKYDLDQVKHIYGDDILLNPDVKAVIKAKYPPMGQR